MQYFTEAYNDFFKNLAANNHKDWFHANKKIYEREVKGAFNKFLLDLIQNIQSEHDASLQLEPKNAVFRINKDIRFAKDKSPYKLHLSAVVSSGGRKNMQIPGMYLQLGVGEIWLGGGMYRPEKENLQKIRTFMAKNPERVKQLLSNKLFRMVYPEGIQGEVNVRVPKEFKQASEKQPLIANKQFYFMANYDDEALIISPDFMEFVLRHYQAGMAWNQFFKEAMK